MATKLHYLLVENKRAKQLANNPREIIFQRVAFNILKCKNYFRLDTKVSWSKKAKSQLI